MIHGHGGNVYGLAERLGCRTEEIIDVSSNINPLGPPPGLMDHLSRQTGVLCSLPEVDSSRITRQMAAFLDIATDRILAGVGTTQFIYTMFPALESKRVLILGPTYADYGDACRRLNIRAHYFLTSEADRFVPDFDNLSRKAGEFDTVVICNPNNPTGVLSPRPMLIDLCRRHPDTRFIIDESYLPFVEAAEIAGLAASNLPNTVVLQSLSKIFRLPGLRVGFIIAPQAVIQRLSERMLPWSINSLAQAAVQYICDHPQIMTDFVKHTRKYIDKEKSQFYLRLQANPALTPFPSHTNYFLIKLPKPITAEDVCAKFAQERVLVRNCSNFFGLTNQFIRIAVNHPDVNRMIADKLTALGTNARMKTVHTTPITIGPPEFTESIDS